MYYPWAVTENTEKSNLFSSDKYDNSSNKVFIDISVFRVYFNQFSLRIFLPHLNTDLIRGKFILKPVLL